MKRGNGSVRMLYETVRDTAAGCRWLLPALLASVAAGVLAALLPPMVLERFVDRLTAGDFPGALPALCYFGAWALSGVCDAAREGIITVFGQRVTRCLRARMADKLERLPADWFTATAAGETVTRFVGDVGTVESLFTNGVISMLADICKVIGIWFVIYARSRGLAYLLILVLPALYWLTRFFQKHMLAAQMDGRRAAARSGRLLPETIRCLRAVRLHRAGAWMEKRYRETLDDGYRAQDRSNLLDALYSPIVVSVSALVVGIMMSAAARGGGMTELFGMSVGTAVAVIAYVSRIFEPLEDIGNEIQNIQAAAAGADRVAAFLAQEEIGTARDAGKPAAANASPMTAAGDGSASEPPVIEIRDLSFGYPDGRELFGGFSLTVLRGETVTVIGRTGAGKSTLFKLLLGLYEPRGGEIRLMGEKPTAIPAERRRRLFGYVEQTFRPVIGSVLLQITLGDPAVSRADAERALDTVGLTDTVRKLPRGIDTPYRAELFSAGETQLLNIARAIAAGPELMLLDEITANLDSATEARVLEAIRAATKDRTVLTISHRIYETGGGRRVAL